MFWLGSAPRSGRALLDDWAHRKLLPKRLGGTLPEEHPVLAVQAGIRERGYWYHGAPDGVLPEP